MIPFEPIAIVGRGCALPGALDPAGLWQLVEAGRCVIGPVPEGHWGLSPKTILADTPPGTGAPYPERTVTDRGGYIQNFDGQFDPGGFALPEEHILAQDPAVRWLLHSARQALAESGVARLPEKTGIIIGNLAYPTAMFAHYAESVRLGKEQKDKAHHRFTAGSMAAQVAGALGVNGRFFSLDAACASSSYALYLACRSLQEGRSDMMLVGGSNHADDLFLHIGFTALQALSPSGRSRPFHRQADGLIPAEGAAMVAVQRLSDAVAENRPILGVIRHIGLSNDGRGKGLLAPDERGQIRAMETVYRTSGIDPRRVSLVECHATGTVLGDGVEIDSMKAIFSNRESPLTISSLKANMGHLITASGMAGLIKVLAAMAHGTLPPTPNAHPLSATIERGPFRVLESPEPWTQEGGPRLAVINNFGFGGNNAHMLLEEWTEDRQSVPAKSGTPVQKTQSAALVAIGLSAGEHENTEQTTAALFAHLDGQDKDSYGTRNPSSADEPSPRRAKETAHPIMGLGFPPDDLKQALPQQLFLMQVVREALSHLTTEDPERAGIVVDMECDTEITRYGLRWRHPHVFGDGLDTVAPALTSAGVLGTMPNILANRINSVFDLRAIGVTIAQESNGGSIALELALAALARGEMDLVIAGAVEIAGNPVHERAMASHLSHLPQQSGDAAIALALKRLDDAEQAGDPIIARIELSDNSTESSEQSTPWLRAPITAKFGFAYSADALLHVALAALSVSRSPEPTGFEVTSENGSRVFVFPHGGATPAAGTGKAIANANEETPTKMIRFPAYWPSITLPAQRQNMPVAQDSEMIAQQIPAPALVPALWVSPESSLPRTIGEVQNRADQPPAPTLFPAAAPSKVSSPGILTSNIGIQPTEAPDISGKLHHPKQLNDLKLDGLKGVISSVMRVHQDYLRHHRRFLDGQLALMKRQLARGAVSPQRAVPAAPRPITQQAPVSSKPETTATAPPDKAPRAVLPPQAKPDSFTPTPVTDSPEAKPVTTKPTIIHDGKTAATWPISQNVSEDSRRSEAAQRPPQNEGTIESADSDREHDAISPQSQGSEEQFEDQNSGSAQIAPTHSQEEKGAELQAQEETTKAPDSETSSGVRFGRRELEILAGGRISSVFGPMFEKQDQYIRQVRMPEPPLLLADRVMDIRGEPGAMKTGTIVTETDIHTDSWYLHQGTAPPGIVIESGQADLLLISWLGVDFLNQDKRVYRLLGCELTFHRSLPRPGETMRFDIHVDGHARQGDIRLFFFHYDCRVDGDLLLSVRSAQAGFFSDEELANSGGVLWSAEDEEMSPDFRLDPPPQLTTRRNFSAEEVESFVRGNPWHCFGEGFQITATHQRTPATPAGRMQLIREVTAFEPEGGPWKRGYLRAESPVSEDDWYFQGHFKNDPCMPGTIMADAAVQTMAFYLTALGFTIHRDGWRFEPVTEERYKFVCRGQVLPKNRHLTYELFVESVEDGPEPRIFGSLLCHCDGLKVFHCPRFGLALVPDWPLTERRAQLSLLDGIATRYVGPDQRVPGDQAALLACAWGRPSEAFGEMYRQFDGPHKVPRLPGPPYHFMTDIESVSTPSGLPKRGGRLTSFYDIPPDAWYFQENNHPVMPFCVLMEAMLQPCGWYASYMGLAGDGSQNFFFRNLDGNKIISRQELTSDSGRLRIEVEFTDFSRVGAMVLVFFRVESFVGTEPVLAFDTSFGFFTGEALANQAGLAASEDDAILINAPAREVVDLTKDPAHFCAGSARLPGGRLRMIDEIIDFQPDGGRAGLGFVRTRQLVDPEAWYFKAHFFQDPVQAGSLGIEAMLQALQCLMLAKGLDKPVPGGRFQTIPPDENPCPLVWKYRGQVLATNREVVIGMHLTHVANETTGVLAIGEGTLWVDGLCIYRLEGLGLRITPSDGSAISYESDDDDGAEDETVPETDDFSPLEEGTTTSATYYADGEGEHWVGPAQKATTEKALEEEESEEEISEASPQESKVKESETPERESQRSEVSENQGPTGNGPKAKGQWNLNRENAPWLWDHCPTYTLPAIPMMALVDLMAQAAVEGTGGKVTEIREAKAFRWVCPNQDGLLNITWDVKSAPGYQPQGEEMAILVVVRNTGNTVARATVILDGNPEPPPQFTVTGPMTPIADPYERLFHGPAFHLIRDLVHGTNGAEATLDATARPGTPTGILHPILLDGLTHAIPHDELGQWFENLVPDQVAYPNYIPWLRLYGPPPTDGSVRVFVQASPPADSEAERSYTARFLVRMDYPDGTPWVALELQESLFPLGELGKRSHQERRDFLRDRRFVPNMRLSMGALGGLENAPPKKTTHLSQEEVLASNWLPGTLEAVYDCHLPLPELMEAIAVKEHLADQTALHPSVFHFDGQAVTSPHLPFSGIWPVLDKAEDRVTVTDGRETVDIIPAREWWRTHLGYTETWPGEGLLMALARRFVRRVVVMDPPALDAGRRKPIIFMANRQVRVESTLFSVLLSGLINTPILNPLRAAQLYRTWVGPLMDVLEDWPGIDLPNSLFHIERTHESGFAPVMPTLEKRLREQESAFLVHAEDALPPVCNRPVAGVGALFPDLAVKTGALIVPVRFSGALPVEGSGNQRSLNLPLGLCAQDIFIGEPIDSAALTPLSHKERKAIVLDAINTLGPPLAAETPNPPDEEFIHEMHRLVESQGLPPLAASILATLAADPETASLAEALLADSTESYSSEDQWLARLRRWVYQDCG